MSVIQGGYLEAPRLGSQGLMSHKEIIAMETTTGEWKCLCADCGEKITEHGHSCCIECESRPEAPPSWSKSKSNEEKLGGK